MNDGNKTGINKGLFDQPGTRKVLWILLWGFCALTLGLEFFIHKEPHFKQENIFGFFGLIGFVACSILILIAKGLGIILKRREDYFDHDDDA